MTLSRAMDELLQDYLNLPNGPRGCVCLCAQRNKTVYEGCFGYSDAENKRPITPDSIFRIFSLTKIITMTAAMMLLEQGKYLLDEPVGKYLPEYLQSKILVPDKAGYHLIPASKPMLIRHAFTMTCGLPYDVYSTEIAKLMLQEEEKLISRVGEHYDIVSEAKAIGAVPLAFEPGERWLYGYGHDIISALISILTDMPTFDYLKKEILDPLGMNSTAYRYSTDDQRRRMCTLYSAEGEGKHTPMAGPRDKYHEPEARYDAGGLGLFSSPRDYLVFTQMLANNGLSADGKRFLGKNTIRLMSTNQLSGQALEDFRKSGVHTSYGYGLGVRVRMPGGGDSIAPAGEFGWSGFTGSWASIDPSSGFSCVYMHQLIPDLGDELHPRVRSVAYGTICNPHA